MTIEILYLDGCPNYKPTRRLIEEVLTAEGLAAEIQEIAIDSARAAETLGFLGSPTVRVNGRDVEPWADRLSGCLGLMGLKCMLYREGNRVLGVPPRRLLHLAVLEGLLGAYQNGNSR